MARDELDLLDDALILSGLADALEELPPLGARTDADRRQRMIATCRAAAQRVAAQRTSEQGFEAAEAYAGGEWRNELLLALFGADGAKRILSRG
ncbi:hypothetical protein [Kytococcus sp. Marseille-QA3725]